MSDEGCFQDAAAPGHSPSAAWGAGGKLGPGSRLRVLSLRALGQAVRALYRRTLLFIKSDFYKPSLPRCLCCSSVRCSPSCSVRRQHGKVGARHRPRHPAVSLPAVGPSEAPSPPPPNGALGIFVKCCARGLIIILVDLISVFSSSAQVGKPQRWAHDHICGEKQSHPARHTYMKAQPH